MSGGGYDSQLRDHFALLSGGHPGIQKQEFMEIMSAIPTQPAQATIEAAFKKHAEDGKYIKCDCMLEAARDMQDSSNHAFVSMTLVQAIEKIHWRKLFDLVDADGGGTIDRGELKSLVDALSTVMNLKGYTQQEAAKYMKEVGTDELDFETFVTVARRLTKGTSVIAVVDKVQEARRAVKERKASALDLFQTRVLSSMLRKRGASMVRGSSPPSLSTQASASEEEAPPPPPPPPQEESSPRGRSPGNVNEGHLEEHLQAHMRATDFTDIFRVIQSDPTAESWPQQKQPSGTQARVQSALHHSHASRVLSILDGLCDEKIDPPKIAQQVAHMCSKIEEAVNGPAGTTFEMQRAAVHRSVKIGNDFLQKIQPPPKSKMIGDVNVPQINLAGASGAAKMIAASAVGALQNNSGLGTRPRRAQTIMDSTFGKEALSDIAKQDIEEVEEARREVGAVQADGEYAVTQIVAPRNKIVELAMSLIPHARSSVALAKSIRRFERQTQELYDCIAYFKFFADFTRKRSASVSFEGESGDGFDMSSYKSPKKEGESAAATIKFSILELLRHVEEQNWQEYAPVVMSEASQEIIENATIHLAWVQDIMKETPTAWIKSLASVAAELGIQVKALAASFLRDRAVQTPTELLIGLQSFPVNFSLKGNHHDPNNAADDQDNAATAREKRRLALAHARIRRSLVSDVTRAAESVDLLIRRYLTAGVFVPANFGRVISTDPDKKKRHTFRFGTRLIDITPMDDRLAVHSCGGYMYFDEFAGKFSEIETLRLERERKRNPHSHLVGTVNIINPYTSPSRSASAATVEVTVRAGSPVQVMPFPGLAEHNSRSQSMLSNATAAAGGGGGGGGGSSGTGSRKNSPTQFSPYNNHTQADQRTSSVGSQVNPVGFSPPALKKTAFGK